MPGFTVEPGETTRFTVAPDVLALMQEGRAQRTAQVQFLVLDLLAEAGRAVALPDGFEVAADDVAGLDVADAAALGLPPRFPGALETQVHRWTTDPEFEIRVITRNGRYPAPHERRGPVLVVGKTPALLTVPQLQALRAIERHRALQREQRTETEAVRLVAQLQAAERLAAHAEDETARSLGLDLGALSRFRTVTPVSVGVTVTPQPDGSLEVEPDLGPSVDRDLLRSRWHQVDRNAGQDSDVLRVGDQIVLLERDQLRGIAEVRRRPRIPAEDVPTFYEAPGSFYDPELVDVDVHLSVRVVGLGVVAQVSYAQASPTRIGLLGTADHVAQPKILQKLASSLAEFEEHAAVVEEASVRGEETAVIGDVVVDVTNRTLVEEYIEAGRRAFQELEQAASAPAVGTDDAEVPLGTVTGGDATDASDDPRPEGSEPGTDTEPDERSGRTETVAWHTRDADPSAARLRAAAEAARPLEPVDWAALRRSPFPHQREGIEWITGLAQAALATAEDTVERIQGALLADDMGLGKTFMTLAALGETVRSQRSSGGVALPMLAVMPVALLENWLAEIDATFGSRLGPFNDVVVLHGDGLAPYRLGGRGKETQAAVEDLDAHGMVRPERIVDLASLRVGEAWGARRLDRPGVLVLTTYETLRRYQVSLALVEWGVVVMDEAQWTKNPDILLTRAAKALRARFRLLATGTPVENSLRDFWCLLDTAQPGLLGSWAQFRENWEAPMASAEGEAHARLGQELRATVGPFMLRRIKEDYLPDLPSKTVRHYHQTMPQVQVQAYDDALEDYLLRRGERGAALKTLGRIREISLHPWLGTGQLAGEPAEIAHSARTLVSVQPVLDEIRDSGEKAIVFVERKELQLALVLWVAARYGIRADVVNGDTSATGGNDSRIGRIRRFEARDGFNVIVMSPKAVGVGLTVVGANHAIHLERLWNPAKEAQATDRIHRIGQTKPVFVHYPMAIHPDTDSFDVSLDRLLQSKVALKDAVVVPQEVSQADLEKALGLG